MASKENHTDHVSRGLKTKDLIAFNREMGLIFLWGGKFPIRVGDMTAEVMPLSSPTRLVQAIDRLVQ